MFSFSTTESNLSFPIYITYDGFKELSYEFLNSTTSVLSPNFLSVDVNSSYEAEKSSNSLLLST